MLSWKWTLRSACVWLVFRSALMLLEFKRDSMEKHLKRLIEDVRERQESIRVLENSGKKLQEIGFTAEEVPGTRTGTYLQCGPLPCRINIRVFQGRTMWGDVAANTKIIFWVGPCDRRTPSIWGICGCLTSSAGNAVLDFSEWGILPSTNKGRHPK